MASPVTTRSFNCSVCNTLGAANAAIKGRVKYGSLRRKGYPLGSGGIESANKFISHVRMKRSGAWWYVERANGMLALRCAKYNGTFSRVFALYKQKSTGDKGRSILRNE